MRYTLVSAHTCVIADVPAPFHSKHVKRTSLVGGPKPLIIAFVTHILCNYLRPGRATRPFLKQLWHNSNTTPHFLTRCDYHLSSQMSNQFRLRHIFGTLNKPRNHNMFFPILVSSSVLCCIQCSYFFFVVNCCEMLFIPNLVSLVHQLKAILFSFYTLK